jgi:hypothetical protein
VNACDGRHNPHLCQRRMNSLATYADALVTIVRTTDAHNAPDTRSHCATPPLSRAFCGTRDSSMPSLQLITRLTHHPHRHLP